MRIETTTTTIYQFDELGKEVQERLIEENRNIEINCIEWFENVIEKWEERLSQIGFRGAEIEFSGFCSQGDGASFDCVLIDCDLIHNYMVMCGATWQESTKYRALNTAWQKEVFTYLKVVRKNFMYVHSNTCCLSWELHSDCSAKKDLFIDTQLDKIEELRKGLCELIYSELEKEFEYLTSDEVVKQYLQDHEFLGNGTIY